MKILQMSKTTPQHQAQRWVLSLVLGSATLVTVLRCFTLTDLGYDLTLQLQAAQHLLAGKGLRIFAETAGLGDPLELRTMTHFPSGYSFYAAAMLSLGLPLALVTMVFGAICSLLGWWGWGRFMLACLGESLDKGRHWRWLTILCAIACPLFFTPAWNGTDIFLWAAVPWVIQWLTIAATATGHRQLALYALTGFVCGLCVLMRYASVVLVGYAGLVIFLQAAFRLGPLTKRWLVFVVALAPPLLLQCYFIFFASEVHATPGGIDTARGAAAMLHGFINGATLLPTANYSLVSWMPDRLLRLLVQSGSQAPWLYLLTLALMSLPFFVARKAAIGALTAASRDVRVVAAGFVVAVPLFLWACMMMGTWTFVSDRRYYQPLIPLALLLVVYLATPGHANMTTLLRRVRHACLVFVAGFAGMMIVGSLFLFIPTAHGAVQRKKLMAEANLQTFPSSGLSYTTSPMRQYVVRRLEAEPDLQLLTNFEAWFYADPTVDLSRVHRILDCESLKKVPIRGPVRFLIVAVDQGDELHSIYSVEATGATGELVLVPCLRNLPKLRLVATFPETTFSANKIKVMECCIPAGTTLHLDEDPLHDGK